MTLRPTAPQAVASADFATRVLKLVRLEGLEPSDDVAFEATAYADSAISANWWASRESNPDAQARRILSSLWLPLHHSPRSGCLDRIRTGDAGDRSPGCVPPPRQN